LLYTLSLALSHTGARELTEGVMEAGFPIRSGMTRMFSRLGDPSATLRVREELFFEHREVLEASGEGNILQGIPHCS
jgi:hypothetical protein